MNSLQIDCGKCQAQLSLPLPEASISTLCPSCATTIRAEVFPALFRKAEGRRAEALFVSDESSCFYHPSKKAVIPCDGCGRFLCSLCDIEIETQHLCPTCVERGIKKGKLDHLQNETTRYDIVAVVLAILPMLIFYLTLFTAPAVLFISIRYWKKSESPVSGNKWRFVAAIVVAGLQIIGWGIGAFALLRHFLR